MAQAWEARGLLAQKRSQAGRTLSRLWEEVTLGPES